MPHVIIKMYPGRTDEVKQRLCEQVVSDITKIAGCGVESVSVAIEEIEPEKWPEAVYRPDIMDKKDTLYKKPGYNPFA